MRLTIHKGTRQIGGNVLELATRQARIMVDMGADLPSVERTEVEHTQPGAGVFAVDGVTVGAPRCDGVFLSHYHADHTGLVRQLLPGIPVYIGKTAREILLCSARHAEKYGHANDLPTIETFRTYEAAVPVQVKDIRVTPFFIDHSAFDAYMFLIEADGLRILYIGDFRIHGFRGRKTVPMLKKYVGRVDYLICEGTLLSRERKPVITERELQSEAIQLMRHSKYVFVLCASTNIDRIGAFYHANREVPGEKGQRLFVCDEYQAAILEIVKKNHADKSDFYNFQDIFTYRRGAKNPKADGYLKDRGFCMMIRTGPWFQEILDGYMKTHPQDTLLIYSMWEGYLGGSAAISEMQKFMNAYPHTILHTSGHATAGDIRQVCETVAPEKGIIPIHGENPEAFAALCPEFQVILPKDGEVVPLLR